MRGLLFIAAVGAGGCNLIFGLEQPQDDDGTGGDGGIDAPRSYADADVSFIPDATDVAVLSGVNGSGQRLAIGSAAGALFVVSSDAGRDVSATTVQSDVPAAIAAIRGDGDDISDLLVATSSGIIYHRGTGKGELVPELELSDPAASLLAVGSYDGGGFDDVVVAHIASVGVSEWQGNGAGGFASGAPFPADGVPLAMAAIDVNRDTFEELLMADSFGVRLYQRTPSGFVVMGDTLSGPMLTVHVMRLDGDDALDVLIGDATGTISVWLGDGNGGFARGPSVLVEPSTTMVLAHGDVDGDGLDDDLAVGGAGAVTLFVADDEGALTAKDRFVVGDPSAVAFADLDGDSQDDLVVLLPAADQVLIFFAQ